MPSLEAVFEQDVEAYHRDLAGRQPELWDGSMKLCETPNQHSFEQHELQLPKRPWSLLIRTCQYCPTTFVYPLKGKAPKLLAPKPVPKPAPEPKPKKRGRPKKRG